MNVRELMDGLRNLDMVLPEFQREFVWEREQAKQLIVSMYRGYPTGSLLFWKTADPPELKNTAIPRDKIGTTMVILDGQQRLTTLYLLTRNEIPPYYRLDDIKSDPRSLYFDLESGDLQYYQVMRMRSNPTWVSVTACFEGSRVNPFEIAKKKLTPDEDPFVLAQRYNENVTRLRNVLERDYPIQFVPSSATIDDAIDVFDRVNSLGTKLTDAELALAHITAKWSQARRVMKDKIAELESLGFSFDLTFMVRGLVAVVNGRALFETIHEIQAPQLRTGWARFAKILDYLLSLLPGHAHIHSTDDLNTTNVLIPPVAYLSGHDGKFPSQQKMRRFVHWMYAASTWARYTSQTDQRLDHDISILQRSESPWRDLVDAIIEQRGRIEVKQSDLEGRGVQHPLYRMTFVLAKAEEAIDWFNGSPLAAPHGSAYAIQSHHIFPTSLLYSDAVGYSPENHLHSKIVNEIANRAFLTGDSNISLGNTEPARYLPQIERKYPGALAKQFVPQDEALWELNRYEDFLAARRTLIAEAINEHMNELLAELEEPKLETLEQMLSAGEGPALEFKSSLRWDLEIHQVNPELERTVAKTAAGMMNLEGGTLLIGVADDASVIGIQDDLKTLGKKRSEDEFELRLREVLFRHLGAEFNPYIHVAFEPFDAQMVCVVRVEASAKPVYLTEKGDRKEFCVRAGNATRTFDIQAAHEYISMHWET